MPRPIPKWVDLSIDIIDGQVRVMIQVRPISNASCPSSRSSLYPIAHRVLHPFTKNANTGNAYEIITYLEDLRRMGLTDADLEALAPLLDDICRTNHKSGAAEKIRAAATRVRDSPPGAGLTLHGKRVIDLLNVSQDDEHGDTADKIFVLEDRTEWGESIVGCYQNSHAQTLQSIKKCISNPTAKRLGCTQEDIALFQRIGREAIEPHCEEMRALYGPDQAAWPSRIKTRASLAAQQQVAALTARRFQSLSDEEKCARIDDLLKTKPGRLPAHLLRIVDKDGTCSHSYELAPKDLLREKPRMVADGVFLRMYFGQGTSKGTSQGTSQGTSKGSKEANKEEEKEIGYIQVKYNNGCWHYSTTKKRWETSSIHTSWNATAFMTRIFEVRPSTLTAL
jgi:hypothetical protein